MKKKFKLITTIASLCLAVALMAFGVYAAINVNYTVTTNVSYQAAKNVKAKVTYRTHVDHAQATTGILEATDTDNLIWEDTIGSAADVLDGVKAIGDVVLAQDFSKGDQLTDMMVFYYTVTFHNNAVQADANKTLNIKVTYPTETTDKEADLANKGYAVEVTELTATTIALGGADLYYTVTITVNPTASLPTDGVDLQSKFELTMTA